MESILNIAWLLLLLPATFIFRQELSRSLSFLRRTRSFASLVCVLALLFPAVSATDDLLDLQRYVEELPVTKQIVKQSVSVKSTPVGSGGRFVVQFLPTDFFRPTKEVHSLVFKTQPVVLAQALSWVASGNDPPCCKPELLVRR